MTRAQADEVLALGRAEIAQWVAKLTPSAGQNAVVEGGMVSLIKPPAPPPVEMPAQTWVWTLFSTVIGVDTTGAEINRPNEFAARVVRSTLGLITASGWSGLTQLLDTPQESGPNLTRNYELTLTARAIKPGQAQAVTSGFTPPDVRVILEEYDTSSDPTAGDVLDTITMTLRNGTVARSFTQRRPGRITSLRIVRVTNLNP
jgi:hypothetical protein